MSDFISLKDGKLKIHYHRSQVKAMKSLRRFVAVVAGTQGGKTCIGPPWLHREIIRCGPGDYMVVSPTYKLLNLKALPEFKRFFETLLGLGRYYSGDKVFVVSKAGEVKLFGEEQETPTKVFFGYAEDPDSLESATAKAAWIDEAGQRKFRLDSWYAILRRLSLHEGRALLTTTLYDLGWLVQKIYNKAKAGDELIELVHFESRDNPMFPQSEWERAKRDLPRWKFDLMYRGIPTRPAGVIYDNFDDALGADVVTPFNIKKGWPRMIGIDFGGVNTVALFYAQDPGSGNLYLYREYKPESKKTIADHVAAILKGEPHPSRCAGGSKSEDQWRTEFAEAGLGVEAPDFSDVEVGIDRVYAFHARGAIKVFSTCEGYLEEKATYRRKLNALQEPTETIEDKNDFHFMDDERYIVSKLGGAEEEVLEVVFDYEEIGGFAI